MLLYNKLYRLNYAYMVKILIYGGNKNEEDFMVTVVLIFIICI